MISLRLASGEFYRWAWQSSDILFMGRIGASRLEYQPMKKKSRQVLQNSQLAIGYVFNIHFNFLRWFALFFSLLVGLEEIRLEKREMSNLNQPDDIEVQKV